MAENANARSGDGHCLCGCGAEVAREFKPGHDAKYKSALVKAAIGGDGKAEAEITKRGWSKFLEKGRNRAEVREHQAKRRATREALAPASRQGNLELLADMKRAAEVLKEIGRYTGPNKIVITRENALEIAERTYDGLETVPVAPVVPARAARARGSKRQQIDAAKVAAAHVREAVRAKPGTTNGLARLLP